MSLARLDNEVFFKKAFTDEIVFKAFVKDIIGIDVQPDKIETEKAFQPRVGNINFKYDIFAEDSKKSIVIEIQKVEYDHNFDRFLHYHLQAITKQQRNSEDYTVQKTVYTIVVITAPYAIDKKSGNFFKDEVLISKLNPENLHGIERKLFNHQLIYLNPNYKSRETPENYRDWLDLIYDSIHNPDNPKINLKNKGVERAIQILNYDNMTPEEMEQAKIETGKQKVILLRVEEKEIEIAFKAIKKGLDNAFIADLTGLDIDFIELIRQNKYSDIYALLKKNALNPTN